MAVNQIKLPMPDMNTAMLKDFLVYAISHPLPLAFGETIRLFGPVTYVPRLGYVVNDPLVSKEILMSPDSFNKYGQGSTGPIVSQIMGDNALINMHGADHMEMRRKVADFFSSRYLDSVTRAVLTGHAEELRRSLAAGEEVDLSEFTRMFTGHVTLHLLGIKPEPGNEVPMYLSLYELAEGVIEPFNVGTLKFSSKQLQRSNFYYEKLVTYARAGYEESDPGSRTIIQLLKGLGLGFEEVKSLIVLLMMVSVQTVSSALPRIAALLADTGQLTILRENRELLGNAIEEGLRVTIPLPIMTRSVAEDADVRGHRFKKGRRVLLFAYNTMKDPKYIPNPRRFDIQRQLNNDIRQLWFGAGPHFCLGFGIATYELETMLGSLLDLPAEYHVAKRRYFTKVGIPAYSKLVISL